MPAIARNDACVFQRAGLKIPGKWRKEPGPAQHITTMKGLDVNHLITRAFSFEGHFAPIDEIEPVRRLALAKNDFIGPELLFGCAMQQDLDMSRIHIAEERMLGGQ